MRRIRVLIVEDSLTVRNRLLEVLASDPEIEVAGEAHDGRHAIELCRALRPDVVTLDMMLPVMSGLAAAEYIMAHCPTPILVVSSSFNRGEVFRTYDALAAGAVDVLEKPNGLEGDGDWNRRFLQTLKLVSRIKVITHLRQAFRPARTQAVKNACPTVVALGASTGGPAALLEILRGLPVGFRLPVLVVLHLSAQFALQFADWLNDQTPHRVAYARDGEPLEAGRVILAPPTHHLIVRQGRLHLTGDPERHSCRPSVDVLFESVAREYGPSAAGCLLTGMGRDGAAGLLEIRRAGGLTLVQDEATSVVYGMPREAVALGAAQQILPLPELGLALAALEPSRDRKGAD